MALALGWAFQDGARLQVFHRILRPKVVTSGAAQPMEKSVIV